MEIEEDFKQLSQNVNKAIESETKKSSEKENIADFYGGSEVIAKTFKTTLRDLSHSEDQDTFKDEIEYRFMKFWTKTKLNQAFKKLFLNLEETRDQPKADVTRDADLLDQIELIITSLPKSPAKQIIEDTQKKIDQQQKATGTVVVPIPKRKLVSHLFNSRTESSTNPKFTLDPKAVINPKRGAGGGGRPGPKAAVPQWELVSKASKTSPRSTF